MNEWNIWNHNTCTQKTHSPSGISVGSHNELSWTSNDKTFSKACMVQSLDQISWRLSSLKLKSYTTLKWRVATDLGGRWSQRRTSPPRVFFFRKPRWDFSCLPSAGTRSLPVGPWPSWLVLGVSPLMFSGCFGRAVKRLRQKRPPFVRRTGKPVPQFSTQSPGEKPDDLLTWFNGNKSGTCGGPTLGLTGQQHQRSERVQAEQNRWKFEAKFKLPGVSRGDDWW